LFANQEYAMDHKIVRTRVKIGMMDLVFDNAQYCPTPADGGRVRLIGVRECLY